MNDEEVDLDCCHLCLGQEIGAMEPDSPQIVEEDLKQILEKETSIETKIGLKADKRLSMSVVQSPSKRSLFGLGSNKQANTFKVESKKPSKGRLSIFI